MLIYNALSGLFRVYTGFRMKSSESCQDTHNSLLTIHHSLRSGFVITWRRRRQRDSELNTRTGICCRGRWRYIRYHPVLRKIQLDINPVIDIIRKRRAYTDLFASGSGKGTILIENTIGCNIISDAEIQAKVDFIVQRFASCFWKRNFKWKFHSLLAKTTPKSYLWWIYFC